MTHWINEMRIPEGINKRARLLAFREAPPDDEELWDIFSQIKRKKASGLVEIFPEVLISDP